VSGQTRKADDLASAAQTTPAHDWRAWVGLLARLVLGITYLVAGIDKGVNLEQTKRATRAFQILPYDLANLWGTFMPFLEVVLGVLLIIGLLTRFTAVLGGLLMVAFIIGIASVWARGISIECGCFGGGGASATTHYPVDLLRDTGLLLCAAWLVLWPGTRLSLDGRLWG